MAGASLLFLRVGRTSGDPRSFGRRGNSRPKTGVQSALLQDRSAQPQNAGMFDWNDLKAFLAVARGGSTLAASKALAVNQTTVARRVESLEAALSLKLF